MNCFELATKLKVRWMYKGQISVEDLWDLTLSQLDMIFKALNKQEKALSEESLLQQRTKKDQELELRIEIVKHIVNTKLIDRDLASKAKSKAALKQRLLLLKEKKQTESLDKLSENEIDAMLADL